MRTWIVGDVQGCAATLQALLAALALRPEDRLWFAGDLVNRGPDNLGVLRQVVALGAQAQAVLGNHDLLLLARAGLGRRPGRGDTLEDVLAAPDREALLHWLRRRPLLHVAEGWILSHAGLDPRWQLAEAVGHARAAEAALRGPGWAAASRPAPGERLAEALAGLTLVRAVDAAGAPLRGWTAAPEALPPGAAPWFDRSPVVGAGRTVFFGHWASLGYREGPGWCGLDSGCVWGRGLTARCVETGAVVQVPTAPGEGRALL